MTTATPPSQPTIAETPPGRALYAGMLLTAMSVLLLEVAVTRVFAILMWHHFAYMVISLALLGFGASGSILTAVRIRERAASTAAIASASATTYAITTVLALFLVVRLQIDSLAVWTDVSHFLKLFSCYAVLAIPLLLAGVTVGTTLVRHPAAVNRLYFADLVGSAIGAAIAPTLLNRIGAPATIVAAAALAALGGAAYAAATGRRRFVVHAIPAIVLALLLVGVCGGGGGIPKIEIRVPFGLQKDALSFFPGQTADATIPSAIAQVDVSRPYDGAMMIGGDFGDLGRGAVPMRAVTQDGTAPTCLYENAADVKRFDALDDTQAVSGYLSLKARGLTTPEVMVIGTGGGVDVMAALFHGAKNVTAVDINPAMIRMVTRDFAGYLGNLFSNPKVELIEAEGRSFLRRSEKSFDLIQLSGVDSYTALNSGAYTLSESYLYTVEAVKDFYAHLNPDGILNYSRFILNYPKRPRETIRLANIAREALAQSGVAEPWRHILILQGFGWASTMIRKGPFTEPEVLAMRKFVDDERFMGLVFDPLRGRDGPLDPGRISATWSDVMAQRVLQDVADARSVGTLALPPAITSAVASSLWKALDGDRAGSDVALAGVANSIPAADEVRASVLAALKKGRDDAVEYGVRSREGFQAAQRNFATIIRGASDERDRFVADYFYDLTPSTDDKPFFFDYFRMKRFSDMWASRTTNEAGYHPDFPVGHMVLLSSLGQISLLALVMILAPLRRLRRQGVPLRERGRTFTYFAALGAGFMLVEVALMQKLSLFLGHPSYSLSVVLAAMLAFSGFGALASARIRGDARRSIIMTGVVIVSLILLTGAVAAFGLNGMLGLAFPVRVAIAIALVAPVGFVLGMALPLGVRAVEATSPALLPWAWAINGFWSVFTSLVAVILAMGMGFAAVFVVAAAVYAAGFLFAPRAGTAAQAPQA